MQGSPIIAALREKAMTTRQDLINAELRSVRATPLTPGQCISPLNPFRVGQTVRSTRTDAELGVIIERSPEAYAELHWAVVKLVIPTSSSYPFDEELVFYRDVGLTIKLDDGEASLCPFFVGQRLYHTPKARWKPGQFAGVVKTIIPGAGITRSYYALTNQHDSCSTLDLAAGDVSIGQRKHTHLPIVPNDDRASAVHNSNQAPS